MKKGKYITKLVPFTTNNLTTGIINFLDSEGHKASRINTQGQWDESIQDWRKSGSTDGVSDVLCCLAPAGLFLAVEVKRGKDRIRPTQKTWLAEIAEAGGLTYIAQDLETFKEHYFTHIKSILEQSNFASLLLKNHLQNIKKEL